MSLTAFFAGRGALLSRCTEEWRRRGHVVAAVLTDDSTVPEQAPAVDLYFLIGYPEEKAHAWTLAPSARVVAYQDALLPAYAGWHATTWAILAGETVHGVTWYTPDAAGAQVWERVEFPLTAQETRFSLDLKCFDAAVTSFVSLIGALEKGTAQVKPEHRAKPSYFGEHQRPHGGGLLDFTRPAIELAALARALDFGTQPNPLGRIKVALESGLLLIDEVAVAEGRDDAAPGRVLARSDRQLTVATAGGSAVRLSGFKDLSGRAVTLGHADAVRPLTTEQIRAVGRRQETLAGEESFWARQLSVTEPLAVPGAIPAPEFPLWATREIRWPAGWSSVEDVLAVQAAFLLRVADVEEGALAMPVDERAGEVPAGFFAEQVPLHVAASYGATFAEFRARVLAEAEHLRARGSYASDLPARYPTLGERPAFDLLLDPGERGPRWRYNARALTEKQVVQLASCLEFFAGQLAGRPDADWRSLAYVPPDQRAGSGLDAPTSAYPVTPDLGQRLDEVAARVPDQTAILYEGRAMSYRELNARANQLAAWLQARGVGPDSRVALLMERAPETMVAVLGVWKAGGCYVPLDPAYPADRLTYMLEQAKPALVLTQARWSKLVPAGPSVFVLDEAFALLNGQPETPVRSAAGPDHLCYVIYTSGSTGRPKGVAMTRRAMHNLMHWQNTVSTPAPSGRTFQYAALSFDVSVQEMLSTWLAGGTLVLVPEEARRDPIRLLRLASETGVQRWFMPYAALQQVAITAEATGETPAALRDVITAGEALRVTPEIRAFFQRRPECRLHNQYGPSETHVVTACVLPSDRATWPDLPSIGGPVANTSLRILDSHGQPVPAGWPGELYLGGDNLARGYLDQPELTAERFVTLSAAAGSGRFYRTGDQVRLGSDGQVEFLGRRDEQVKIRGYRIELAEVESALGRHPEVRECAVVARVRDGLRYLAAYVTVRDRVCRVPDLRAHLQSLLPEYMVPTAWMILDQFPLTPSGKIHRRALPEPVRGTASAGETFRAPQGEVEQMIGRLWQQVLGVERVGTTDNFFELGGDSIKLARVQAGLRSSLGREVPILDLFRFPVLGGLAAHLTGSGTKSGGAVARPARRPVAGDAVAVIGMAGRFPGAENIEQLWRHLCEGRELITRFADDELEAPAPKLEEGSGLRFVKARGVLERSEWFDAGLFGYGPRDAELMDPQHRVFLECAWEALEHAGCDPARYPGAIGVFAASSLNTYFLNNVLGTRAAVEELVDGFQVSGYPTIIGNDKDYVASRVAYKLNLRGPSLAIQSACSSSLVAICQACHSLMVGDSDVVLAGGVSITYPQKRGYLYVEGSIASADGHCRPFDASAAGTVFGAGAGLVVLKRLADAQADGDTIYGVLKGWALNNDGAIKAGFMAPSAEGQAEVIRMAQERAAVTADTIGLVETHGTGTPLGDPIEVAGLTRAFRLTSEGTGTCALGSVKANIGHLESAAGVTGLIKTVLSLYHRTIPPLLHFEKPNPLIDLPATPFYAPRQLTAWPDGPTPRRAGVSSFGVGGTNAHVVVEESPSVVEPVAPAKPAQLLLFSAHTETALKSAAGRLADFLEQTPGVSLAAAAYTLQAGRTALERRAFVIADSRERAVSALRGTWRSRRPNGRAPSVVFLFPGQGSQYPGMARGLYECEPVFRRVVDECVEILRPLLGLDLLQVMHPDANGEAVAQERLTQTRFAQPALFTLSYALARWWESLGVRPAAMIGHSIGEYAGACWQGIFSLEDALRVVVKRGELMQAQPPGKMLSVRLSEEEVQPYLGKDIALAAANAPALSVLSGPSEAVEALARQLEEKGQGGRVLQTSHAFHSSMMEPALEPFRQFLRTIKLKAPEQPFLSSMTGGWVPPDQVAEADYWVRQIREPVRFSKALTEAAALDDAVFLEAGPGQALTTLALQHEKPETPVTAIPSQRHAKENLTDYEALLRAVGQLWSAGQNLDWAALHGGVFPRKVALPTYPFERKRYWIEPPLRSGETAAPIRPGAESEPVPETSAAAAAPASVLDEVLDILQDLSGIDRETMVPQRPFLEMGFDSLFLTQVSLAFQRKFLVKLTLRQMLDQLSSPAAIAAYIESNRPAVEAPAPVAPVEVVPAAAASVEPAGPFGPGETSAPAPVPLGRHGPFAPINKAAGDALTPRQQQHLDALIARYTKRTAKSKEYTRQNRDHFADPRAVSGFRVTWKEIIYPIVSSRSAGSKLWDLDGNEFLDVTMGFGTNLFGHNPDFIRAALEAQLAKGIEIGPQSGLAGEIARRFCAMVGQERATFCNTGSEAVMGAVRAARTVTGRQQVVYFAGDYHGVHDEVLAKGQPFKGRMRTVPIAPGIPNESVSQITVLPYGEDATLDLLRAQAGSLAAVLVEPVQSRKPQLQPRAFLQKVREITRQAGAAMIMDEVITGFRVHPGGAQAWFDVKADIATYGKIIGGGMPIGVIAGSRAYMDAFDGGTWSYGDDSVPEAGVTFFAGTFVRHPLAMAAARAVLDHLQEAGPGLQQQLNERTTRFVGQVNDFMAAEGVDVRIHNFGSLWYFSHGDRFTYFSLLFHFLRDLGIHIWEGRPCFLSTAHSEADVARLVDAFKRAIHGMREGGFLPEPEVVVPADGPFPLTDAQQEISLAMQLDAASAPAFNESCSLTFLGTLDRAALTAALRGVVERHEALRTSVLADGTAQQVQPPSDPELGYEDLVGLRDEQRQRRLDDVVREEVQRPFDLTRAPLLRGRLLRLDEQQHVLVLTAHHIVCDGWSYDVMARDLGALYELARRGERDQRPSPMPFRDYARWMQHYRADARHAADLAYWVRQLEAPPEPIHLPTDRTRPPTRTFAGAMEVATVEGPLVAAIKELGAQKKCTLFSTLLALYAVLLHRLTGQSDLVIGIPAAGQQLVEGQGLVGHCANLLPLRLRINSDQPLSEVLAAAQHALLEGYEHQGITFGELLKELQLPRDPSRSPLIQVTFNVDPAIHGLQFGDLKTEIVINPRTAYQFEHSLNIVAGSDRLRIECNYNTDLFDAATMARWLGLFRNLAQAAAEQPDRAVGSLPWLGLEERNLLVKEWSGTASAYPGDQPIHALFEDVVRQQPDRVAILHAGESLTYGELNRRANRLARRLVAAGVTWDQPVGLCAERSPAMIIGLLGILKAGGAYLPLDPQHPDERIKMQIEDALLKVVVAQDRYMERIVSLSVKVVPVEQGSEAGSDADLQPGERSGPVPAHPLAYVLYTSGSTGTPKGVMIEQRSVVRLVRQTNFLSWQQDDVVSHLAPLAFDASTLEIWGALLNGAQLALLPPGPFSFENLAALIRDQRVTLLWLTTSLFHQLVDDHPGILGSVKVMLTGGEVTSGERIARILKQYPGLRVVHAYGPTECTTFATTETFVAGDRVEDPLPLGRPIANTQVYVLDERRQPSPVDVPGELYLGGDGVARGYLNRPDLTAQAFVPNPFEGTPGERLYRTGDRARWRADGHLEFLGRLDGQVKIRGFRIEPGEVEAVLLTYPGLRHGAVVVRTAPTGDKQLVAYLSMLEGQPAPSVEQLRAQMGRTLPDFMIPSVFSVQPALPMNPGGKVDRRALPEPGVAAVVAGEKAEPANDREKLVAAIWAQVLGLSKVSSQDDFFALGGHSLAALKMIDRLREAGYALEVADLFRNSTVDRVARAMKPLAAAPLGSRDGEFIVPLQKGQPGRTPLFLLPSDFGDLLIYTNMMPHLDPSLPCYGLQSPKLYEQDQGLANMQDYASLFVRNLRTVQPKGPYRLAGYCFGGLVAMEMAKLLKQEGEVIELLALIDARPYQPVVAKAERMHMYLRGALRAKPADWKRHLSARWSMWQEGKLIDRLARKHPARLDRRDLNRWVLESRVMRDFHSGDYDGEVMFIYPAESQFHLYGDPSCGWLNLAERVNLFKVSGSHLNMMKEPHVRQLAAFLQDALRRLETSA